MLKLTPVQTECCCLGKQRRHTGFPLSDYEGINNKFNLMIRVTFADMDDDQHSILSTTMKPSQIPRNGENVSIKGSFPEEKEGMVVRVVHYLEHNEMRIFLKFF